MKYIIISLLTLLLIGLNLSLVSNNTDTEFSNLTITDLGLNSTAYAEGCGLSMGQCLSGTNCAVDEIRTYDYDRMFVFNTQTCDIESCAPGGVNCCYHLLQPGECQLY